MSASALQYLHDVVMRLDAALQGEDVARIERAVADIRPILENISVQGAWHITSETRDLLNTISQILDTARVRVSVGSDVTRRRLDMLASRGVAVGPATYRR